MPGQMVLYGLIGLLAVAFFALVASGTEKIEEGGLSAVGVRHVLAVVAVATLGWGLTLYPSLAAFQTALAAQADPLTGVIIMGVVIPWWAWGLLLIGVVGIGAAEVIEEGGVLPRDEKGRWRSPEREDD